MPSDRSDSPPGRPASEQLNYLRRAAAVHQRRILTSAEPHLPPFFTGDDGEAFDVLVPPKPLGVGSDPIRNEMIVQGPLVGPQSPNGADEENLHTGDLAPDLAEPVAQWSVAETDLDPVAAVAIARVRSDEIDPDKFLFERPESNGADARQPR